MRRYNGSSLLYEVQAEEGDERSEVNYTQEWQASSARYVSRLRHEDVQDRKSLRYSQLFTSVE